MNYIPLISLFIGFGQAFVAEMKDKLPAEILASLQASLAALQAHKDDLLTKANFEAQRG